MKTHQINVFEIAADEVGLHDSIIEKYETKMDLFEVAINYDIKVNHPGFDAILYPNDLARPAEGPDYEITPDPYKVAEICLEKFKQYIDIDGETELMISAAVERHVDDYQTSTDFDEEVLLAIADGDY